MVSFIIARYNRFLSSIDMKCICIEEDGNVTTVRVREGENVINNQNELTTTNLELFCYCSQHIEQHFHELWSNCTRQAITYKLKSGTCLVTASPVSFYRRKHGTCTEMRCPEHHIPPPASPFLLRALLNPN
jgi:hypothetical protein